jgi:hypothetical protein
MAFKGKTQVGNTVTKTKFSNGGGHNPSAGKLGFDTQPGPGPGAPLVNSRKVDDYNAVKTVYNAGVYPGSMTGQRTGNTTMEFAGDKPTIDGPASRGPTTHPDLMTKADNAAYAEATIGNRPRGVLGR